MVVFDCERMKYPNTGLFSFCDNVAANLVKQRSGLHDRLCMYVPSGYRGRWGGDVDYRTVHPLHKLHIFCSGAVRVWHSAHQQTAYVPPAGVKSVLTVHDLNFLYEKPARKHPKYLKALQKLVDRADRIVAISESTRKDLCGHIDIKGKRTDVVYNGLNMFEGDITPPVSKPDGEFLFSVGTVLPKKNFHVLPALLEGNDFRLIIAGNKSPYEDRIMEEAGRFGVRDRVFVIGPVSEPVKFWYIKNCTAFLFPSIAEGFGLPVIEAMYYRKPVFLSDRTSLPEIGDRFAFYFDHDFEPERMQKQFREGLEAFRTGRFDSGRMKSHAMSFSWERTARRYMEIYNSLLVSPEVSR